jgi:hypothetical protein
MPKRPELNTQQAGSLFTDTSKLAHHEKPKPPAPKSVRLSADDLTRVEAAAERLGLTTHALMHYAIMYFLKDYEAGKIPIETKPTLPDL